MIEFDNTLLLPSPGYSMLWLEHVENKQIFLLFWHSSHSNFEAVHPTS